MTASLIYNRPIRNGNWASTIVWGRTRSLQDKAIFNSYLVESTLQFYRRNRTWMRIENADRSNELVFGGKPLPSGFQEMPFGRVQAYTIGYDRDVDLIPFVSSAIGGQATFYGVPDVLKPIYSSHPAGVAIFLRLRTASREGK